MFIEVEKYKQRADNIKDRKRLIMNSTKSDFAIACYKNSP